MEDAEQDRQEPAEPGPADDAGRGDEDRPVERGAARALGSTLSTELRRATRGRRRGSTGTRLVVTGAEQVAGLRPRLLESLALRRAHRGGVAKLGDHYYDWGFPMPGYLTYTLDGLANAGLLALVEVDQCCLRRVSLTETGQARYAELCDKPRQATAGTPAKTPAGRQPSCPEPLPAPGSQPDPTAP